MARKPDLHKVLHDARLRKGFSVQCLTTFALFRKPGLASRDA
jgi:hypothetical protein